MQPYYATLLGAILLVCLSIMPHQGFVLLFFVPFVVFYWLIAGVRVIIRQHNGHAFFYKTIIWLLAISSVVVAHLYYAQQAHNNAQRVANELWAYQQQHGHFPPNLSTAYIKAGEYSWRVFYHHETHHELPTMFYRTTFIVFDTYQYDFKQKTWFYQPH